MKFISSRDIRNNPSEFRDTVEREDVVLTVGGKPFAIVVGVDEDAVEETIELLRRVRALQAMTRMQERAAKGEAAGMSPAEIEEEVRASRRARRRSA